MEIIKSCIDLFLHLDVHMAEIIGQYGSWVYALVFVIIFAETGFIVTPFLPGDSLLFVLGAFAAKGALNLNILIPLLSIAAIAGDMINYSVGRFLAPKIFNNEKIRFLKQEHLQKTQDFYKKYGAKTIILARFIPIIRTFAPFLAGVGSMPYPKFLFFNISGGLLWVFAGVLSGFFFGNLPFVSEHFSLVVLAIVVISLIPAVWEYIKHKQGR